jgi:hypothetical protein
MKPKNKKQGKKMEREPGISLQTITISTLADQEEANYRYWLKLTPEKRLELHYMLISEIYLKELNREKNKYNIIFTS